MSATRLLLRRSLWQVTPPPPPPPPVLGRKSQSVAPVAVLLSAFLLDHRFRSTTNNKASSEGRRTNHTFSSSDTAGSDSSSNGSPQKESESSSSSSFDVSKQWQEARKDGADYLRKLLNVAADLSDDDDKTGSSPSNGAASTKPPPSGSSIPNENSSVTKKNSIQDRVWSKMSEIVADAITNNNKDKDHDEDSNKGLEFQEMMSTVMNLIKGRVGGGGGGGESKGTLEDMVDKARSLSEQGGVSDKTSLTEVLDVTQKAAKALDDTMVAFLGDSTSKSFLPVPYPTNLFYFIEREDERKNPSWRRRVHRFCTGIDVSMMDELHTKLELAALAYSDSLVEIRSKLALPSLQYELLYCAMDSYPGKPSHFVAIKKTDQSQSKGRGFWKSNDPLEVILVVRGTKTISDVITDLLSHPEDYRGGKAHSGILQSGLYLAQRHDDLWQELFKLSGSRRKIKLTLIGHSLGAGMCVCVWMI
jgi:Lipase (class 3)